MGKNKKKFIKIISFRINLDHFILAMTLAFTFGAMCGIGGLYFGLKYERERYKASLYHANHFVEKAEKRPSDDNVQMTKLSFR